MNRRQFVCLTGAILDPEEHCDSRIDCRDDGEDEYFCDIRESRWEDLTFFELEKYLSDILVYPTSLITVDRNLAYIHEVNSGDVQKLEAIEDEIV